jgi:hypothetical protein
MHAEDSPKDRAHLMMKSAAIYMYSEHTHASGTYKSVLLVVLGNGPLLSFLKSTTANSIQL